MLVKDNIKKISTTSERYVRSTCDVEEISTLVVVPKGWWWWVNVLVLVKDNIKKI